MFSKFFPYSREVTDRVTDPAKPKTITFTPCESVKNRAKNFQFLNKEKRFETKGYKDNYIFPFVVGTAFAMNDNEISSLIEGENGVYKVLLSKKNIVTELDDYTSYSKNMQQKAKETLLENIFSALESVSEIVKLESYGFQINISILLAK